MKNRRPKHDPSWRYDCMTQRHPKQFETYSPLLPLLINISSSLHQISTYHTKLSLHLFLPVVCNWSSKFKGNTLSSENVGFLVYLFFYMDLFSICAQGSEEAITALPVLQFTIWRHHWRVYVWQLCLWDNGESARVRLWNGWWSFAYMYFWLGLVQVIMSAASSWRRWLFVYLLFCLVFTGFFLFFFWPL